tara:strand:+ start:899 stop:1126 length:228 start_codon:yes stop_codon:yes gene_type:complete
MKDLKISVMIGKNGLNLSLFNEIRKQLKQHKIVKIKFLKSFIDRKDRKQVAKDIALECKANLEKVVGFTFVLAKK